MANITINEVSQNYSYSISNSSYATVALPITSCWGPGFFDPASLGKTTEEMLEETAWSRFPATQQGLESFVATYRGVASNYRLAKDYSYQMAMTLLAAGYDVLVCRLCPGTQASGKFELKTGDGTFSIKAKYPGTFGNTLQVVLRKVPNRDYWNIITYTIDASGVRSALENIIFVFDIDKSTDSILHIDEVESSFLSITCKGITKNDVEFKAEAVSLTGGTDVAANTETMMDDAIALATARYKAAGYTDAGSTAYVTALTSAKSTITDAVSTSTIKYREWTYTYALEVYELIKDKLSYNPNRIISPGWDDQDYKFLTGELVDNITEISPIHIKLMDVAYYSRCATAFLDIPKSLPRSKVYNESLVEGESGYAQLLSRYVPSNALYDLNTSLYSTHSALFAPWGQYTYVGTGKQAPASPSFQALMIHRAMILNQAVQYEWALPTNRKHNLKLGKFDYNVPKKLLDEWQSLEGVGVNIITTIPDLGTTVWGNSTLYEVPPATYQALANLSTRFLVNAIEDVVYRAGISITFTYNNTDAYGSFYAAVTPILDTMKNVGAIEDYLVKMSADIDGEDRVNANTVIGKIWITVNGVINDIIVDLVALPPNVDLAQFE